MKNQKQSSRALKDKIFLPMLKFMWSMIERTCRKIGLGWPIMIIWGLIMDIRMIKLRWSGFIALVLAVIGIVMPQMLVAETLPEPFKLIPQPRQMELIGGAGLKFGDLKAVLLNADSARPVTGPILSCLRQTDKDSKGVLSLKIAKGSSIPESSEGYILVIADGKAKITSCSPAGLFYGCQSLEQLLEDARDTDTPIPACKITDYPALSYRAVHFDVKHHLDTAKYYYDSIDRLARYKINAIIFEFEDKLRYKQQPLVGAPQAISISEMVALTNYARRRHIEITPLVQGLGHASYILKHQEYSHLREDPNSNWAFCPLNEGTYQVLFDLYRDAMEATPGSRYLHVGGDEVSKIGTCHRCKPFVEKKGIFELNLYWLNRVCEFVAEQGRVPIFWDDMPFKHAGVWSFVCYGEDNGQTAEVWEKGLPILNSMIERYPKNCIYMRWNYKLTRHLGTTRALDWYRDHGLTVMAATASGGGKVLLDDRVNFIQSYISLAAERGIDGMLCTAWDDASPHMETFWRGFIASAEFSWSQSVRTLKEYEAAYLQRMFGPECATATNLYAELFEACQFWSKTLLAEGEERG